MRRTHEALLVELLAECTDMLQKGMPIAACLESHPGYAAEIEPLLTTTAHVQALRVPPRAPEAAARSKAAFMAAARQLAAARVRPAGSTLFERLYSVCCEEIEGSQSYAQHRPPKLSPPFSSS